MALESNNLYELVRNGMITQEEFELRSITNAFNAGYDLGVSETQSNSDAEYDRGYSHGNYDGYDHGYRDGVTEAKESNEDAFNSGYDAGRRDAIGEF